MTAKLLGIYPFEFEAITDAVAEGRVVPFLGAGFNLSDRPAEASWSYGQTFLPNGTELARHLAARFHYPRPDQDLARICQFAVELRGLAPLYSELRSIFAVPCELTSAHRFLARLPALLRSKNSVSSNPLIVTTNYDNLVERAFAEQREPLDIVTYVADGNNERGRFAHTTSQGERILINRPNEYAALSFVSNSILLKIHGAMDSATAENDSFVITEDHYINFLARGDLSHMVPVTLAGHLRASHFLFLGYSLRDWNLRVILQRIWDEQRLGFNSWAVQRTSDDLDRRFWSRRNVQILEATLADALSILEERLRNLPQVR